MKYLMVILFFFSSAAFADCDVKGILKQNGQDLTEGEKNLDNELNYYRVGTSASVNEGMPHLETYHFTYEATTPEAEIIYFAGTITVDVKACKTHSGESSDLSLVVL